MSLEKSGVGLKGSLHETEQGTQSGVIGGVKGEFLALVSEKLLGEILEDFLEVEFEGRFLGIGGRADFADFLQKIASKLDQEVDFVVVVG